ncbi:inhibitor of growth protein 3-like isoform X2 [Asterias rubens]|uniref:inhibitor of growth protein 3-like isoform X2 n=1 Tax=Asterias rubens TaxID=7604 RepID=UPI001455933D|nr:inhibitor of growth protein 3-like isoform X2 [Asterias rubens]
MLYLEDYLEMIEQLPMDLRERFTEIREMDLQVQNAMDNLDDRVKKFFEAAKKTKPEAKIYEAIRKDYYKVLEDCDEKVQLANQVYDLVDRYLRKLDQELNKFKMELEADNAGITEVLERRSLELDIPQKQMQAPTRGEKRKNHFDNHVDKKSQSEKKHLSNLNADMNQDMLSFRSSSLTMKGGSSLLEGRDSASAQPALSYSLGHVGAGSNAIALAAAQAVSNTLQMQQGRRTASLKASYEALKSGGFSGLGGVGRDTSQASSSTAATTSSTPTTTESGRHRGRRNNSRASTPSVTSAQLQPQSAVSLQPLADLLTDSILEDTNPPAPDWSYDPNEPRYCLCNQVSYGEMVGCDNNNCPIEWFHYGCVGITNPPKGKWFCPQCTVAMKRREKKDSSNKK